MLLWRIGNASIILKTEQKATFLDGTISLAIGLGLVFLSTGWLGLGSGFIAYLADSFFVLALAVVFIKEPIKIIMESLIELVGGTLQNKQKRRLFEKTIHDNMPDTLNIEDIFISKSGSKYIIVIYISINESSYSRKDIIETKDKIYSILGSDHPYLSLEMIPESEEIL